MHLRLPDLPAGQHELVLGGFQNKKTVFNEFTYVLFDDVRLFFPKKPAYAVAETRILRSSDDAEEGPDGTVKVSSGDLELVEDQGATQTVGLRFELSGVPQGSSIKYAYVQFTADELDQTPTRIIIEGEARDHASTFRPIHKDLTSRPRTQARVEWHPPFWTVTGDLPEVSRTPDLALIVQEVIDRSGWKEGNALAFLMSGSGTRTADSYDVCSFAAPLLHVEYEEAEGRNEIASDRRLLFSDTFDQDQGPYRYLDDPFQTTSQPAYASGAYDPVGGYLGGGLVVQLGGVDNDDILRMSGGWQRSFSIREDASEAWLTLRYQLVLSRRYNEDEWGQVLVKVDDDFVGGGSRNELLEIRGKGDRCGNGPSGWVREEIPLGRLAAGEHLLTLAGLLNKKTVFNEFTHLLFDEVSVQIRPLALDLFEADNTPEQARPIRLHVPQNRNFHSGKDEDWVRFEMVSGLIYRFKTTQLGDRGDTVLDLFSESRDGRLTPVVRGWNRHGAGIGITEDLTEQNPQTGTYYLRVRPASSQSAGPGTEYLLELETVGRDRNSILVAAIDRLSPDTPVADAVAIVDGVDRYDFGGSTILDLTGRIAAGEHTFEVRAKGYKPVEHPFLPHQVENQTDSSYGNPRTLHVGAERPTVQVFQFWPTVQAQAEVMDFITGEPLAGVEIRFRAISGLLNGLLYDGYPAGTPYQSSWQTTETGTFPDDLFLPTVDWDLMLVHPGYQDELFSGSVVSPSPGGVVDLGNLFLTPRQVILKPDVFEPDDTFDQATTIGLKVPQRHNIHQPEDEDWVRLSVVTNLSYRFKTVQQGRDVDTVLDLFVEELDGNLAPVVERWNEQGFGAGIGEELVRHDLPSGIYYLRITDSRAKRRSRNPGSFASEETQAIQSTAYDVVIETPGGPITIVLLGAVNRLSPEDPPVGGVAVVDGVSTHSFSSGITIDLTGQLSPGVHTVRVEAAGYLPVEDPFAAGEVQNQDNGLYGNPRRITVADGKLTAPFFMMWPMVQVEAVVRDAWTGEPVVGAAIQARGISGVLSNVVYTGYPAATIHEEAWMSEVGGSFPSPLWLPTVDWDLSITKEGYAETLLPAAVLGPDAGDLLDLGVIDLSFSNHPPEVVVGEDRTVSLSEPFELEGEVSDDGFPLDPGATTVAWSILAGPAPASFSNDRARLTRVSFSAPGLYTLRLTASDGNLSSSASFTVSVLQDEGTPFMAYNDLSWGNGQLEANITRYTTASGVGVPPQGDQGPLVDYDSGLPMAATLSVTGGTWNGEGHARLGGPSILGTEAYDEFEGRVDTVGVANYAEEDLVLTFSGLSPPA